tara:strand:+ start:3378 stop:3479 length:102 start_codon:yes stop_codon:yes gene_type:complete
MKHDWGFIPELFDSKMRTSFLRKHVYDHITKIG